MWPPNDDPTPTPNNDPGPANADVDNITDERAARRFHQMRHQEQMIAKLDTKIADVKTKLSTLKEERDGIVQALLSAARDEGDLPLFNFD